MLVTFCAWLVLLVNKALLLNWTCLYRFFFAGSMPPYPPQWGDVPVSSMTMQHHSSSKVHSALGSPGHSLPVASQNHSLPIIPTSSMAVENGLASCNDSEHFSHSVTPPPLNDSNRCSSTTSDQFSGSEDEAEEPPRKRRNPVPPEKKDAKYWERRRKNNLAAKRSREMKRKKVEEELVRAKDAIVENQKMKQEVEVLKAEINSLRRLLKDANMTLSLWIRARQASEPSSQLPPMLRNPNMSFVSFPVTSSL